MKNKFYNLFRLAALLPFLLVCVQLRAQDTIYYNAGGAQYISLAGDTFIPDLHYTMGATTTYTNPTPDLAIANTDDDVLFRTERSANSNGGNFSYNLAVENGTYNVKLYFAEIFFGAQGGNLTPPFNGKRVFHVLLEGDTVLKNYDIYVAAGNASATAVLEEFDNIAVNDGVLEIFFDGQTNRPKISALVISPISLTPPDTTNTPPTFTLSGNVTAGEDFPGTQTVTVTPDPVPPAEAGQIVAYSLTPPSVAFANVSINSSTGLVSITKVTNGTGSQLFTITANDGQGLNNTATQNFTLTVTAANDAPAFTTSGSITVNKNFAGTQTVTVTPSSVPTDETAQVVTYSLNPPSIAFANVSINTGNGQVSITSVLEGTGSQLFTITANDGQGLNNTATQNFTLTVNDTTPAPQEPIYFNCGGPQYITLAGDTFVPDLFYSSGTTTSSNNIVTDILGTNDDVLYRTERFKSEFTYNIPVQNGAYNIDLHFAEIFFGVQGGNLSEPFTGKRVFHVLLEGDTVLKNYDINADVGPGTAVIKQYDNVQINDGTVTIHLKGVTNNPKISAISITPETGTPNTPPTVSITAPNAGASFIEASAIQIDADADDTDGSISKVEFYENGNLLDTDLSEPYSFIWNNSTPGNKALTAKAFDNNNASTTSLAVNINITPDMAPAVSLTNPEDGATFIEGASILIEADANDDVAVTLVEFYEGLNLLGSDNSFPYSFPWNSATIGNHSITAKAYDGFGNSTTSSAIEVNVVADMPPIVSITSPADGASFTEGQTVVINANASDDVGIAQVDFYAGAGFLGSDNSFPYSFNWTNAPVGSSALTAIAYDSQFQGTVSDVVNITVDTIPAGNLEALLVVGNLSLNNGDQALKTRLETLGFNVTVVLGTSSATSDANGKNLVFISSTVTAASVGNKFTGVTVPVINCEQGLHDDFGMTSSVSGNSGSTASQTQINIIGAGHPIAASLPNAPVTIYTSAQTLTWGKPNINAVKIATTMSSSSQITIFGYETGVAMVSGNAPARRLGFVLQDAGAAFLTASGTALLDAAITWAANSTPPPPNTAPSVSITNPLNGAVFNAPANITIDATASDPDLGGSISKVEFYEGLNLLHTDFTFPYSFGWNNVGAGNYQITAKAFDNLNASTTSAIVNVAVNAPANNPPSVTITNPLNNASFNAPANITIDASASDPDFGGSISKVEFYEGLNLLHTDFTFPYSFGWNGVGAGNYQITAKAFDNLNASTTSAIVNVTVNPVATLGNILLVVGNLSLNNGDNAIKARLETLGYSVTLKLASASVAADANGKSAVIISSTTTSTDIGNKFTNVAVPVMNCEQALHDDFKFVSSSAGNAGSATNQTVLNIIGAGHPLAASLPNGLTAVYTSAQTVTWGKPSVNAIKIATTSGSATNIAIFGYEVNATMVGLNAPARRLGFFLQDAGAAFLTANGTALFDAAINWLVSTPAPNNPPSVSITNPVNNTSFTAPATITIDASASDPDLGGTISIVEFYQGVTFLGSDNTFPYSFTWNNVPQGNYQLTAKAFDNLHASATSAIINISVNPPANNQPLVNITAPANGALFTAPANITIDASASDPDLGGSIFKVEFYQGVNLLGTDFDAPYSFAWNGVTQGNYQLTARAFDNLNVSTTSAIVNITVNQLPTVSITSPANAAVFNAPANITIDATAGDVGGTISKVEFYEGLNLLGTDFNAPYSFNWNNVSAGNYQLTAKAFDNLNATTTSSIVNISVNAPVNNAPSVSITNPLNNATFTAPANVSIAVSASDPDVGGSIFKVEFYVGNTLLGTDFTLPYSLSWNGVGSGTYNLKAKAFDNLNASTVSSIITITINPSGNLPPVVSITSPTNNAVLIAPANITINASASDPTPGGSITKVEFYQGVNLLNTDFIAPYSFDWNGVTAGIYQLTAKAFDNQNAVTTSSVINILVNNPSSNTALLVVGNTTLNTGDAAVKAKLESMGFTVTVVGDAASTTADASGKTLVYISATVGSTNVNTKFTNVTVPVINSEPGIMDDLKLTVTASTEYGSAFNQTQINIIGAGHPLAAGLSNGITTVFQSVQTVTWGKPNANAVSIATVAGNATQVCIFGYQTGAGMAGINAPARRVGFMTADQTPAALNTAGMQLLEAAILWAVGTSKNEEPATAPAEISMEANVYPNPSSGIFNLQLNNAREGKLSVGVYNQFGQEVYFTEKTIDNVFYLENFDLTSLPSGLYLIHITNGENKFTRRILISTR